MYFQYYCSVVQDLPLQSVTLLRIIGSLIKDFHEFKGGGGYKKWKNLHRNFKDFINKSSDIKLLSVLLHLFFFLVFLLNGRVYDVLMLLILPLRPRSSHLSRELLLYDSSWMSVDS